MAVPLLLSQIDFGKHSVKVRRGTHHMQRMRPPSWMYWKEGNCITVVFNYKPSTILFKKAEWVFITCRSLFPLSNYKSGCVSDEKTPACDPSESEEETKGERKNVDIKEWYTVGARSRKIIRTAVKDSGADPRKNTSASWVQSPGGRKDKKARRQRGKGRGPQEGRDLGI